MSKTPRLPSTQLHGELQGVWLLSTPTLQLSRVYLPSTCDITHVITYTRPSSLLFYFWVRGRGRPGDEANCSLQLPRTQQGLKSVYHVLQVGLAVFRSTEIIIHRIIDQVKCICITIPKTLQFQARMGCTATTRTLLHK